MVCSFLKINYRTGVGFWGNFDNIIHRCILGASKIVVHIQYLISGSNRAYHGADKELKIEFLICGTPYYRSKIMTNKQGSSQQSINQYTLYLWLILLTIMVHIQRLSCPNRSYHGANDELKIEFLFVEPQHIKSRIESHIK